MAIKRKTTGKAGNTGKVTKPKAKAAQRKPKPAAKKRATAAKPAKKTAKPAKAVKKPVKKPAKKPVKAAKKAAKPATKPTTKPAKLAVKAKPAKAQPAKKVATAKAKPAKKVAPAKAPVAKAPAPQAKIVELPDVYVATPAVEASSELGSEPAPDAPAATPSVTDSSEDPTVSDWHSTEQKFLDGYSGQSARELIALAGEYRVDSIVLAFEWALDGKAEKQGAASLSDAERVVLAVESLEREVNNGGFEQFFLNSSRRYVSAIAAALERIGCPATARITRKAIDSLSLPDGYSADDVLAAMDRDDDRRLIVLEECDQEFYQAAEPIAQKLFDFIQENVDSIVVP